MRGELRMRQNRLAEAEESLRAAMTYARERGAKSFELRAATGLARLLAATNRAAEARDTLAPVYDWFTEGLGTMDLIVARTLLNELQGN